MRRLLGIAILILILVPASSQASTLGFSVGDSVVYSYTIVTTYAAPLGNHSNTMFQQFTLDITSVNKTNGEIGYTEAVTVANNTVLTTADVESNFTTVFNPYDNNSYLGNIGSEFFVYTDLRAGSVRNMSIKVGNGSYPGGAILVNATVARPPGSIDVNLSMGWDPAVHPMLLAMQFDSTTGLLVHATGSQNTGSTIWVYVTYELVSYVHHTPADYWYVWYIVAALIVVFVVVAVVRRAPRKQRNVTRIRDKFR